MVAGAGYAAGRAGADRRNQGYQQAERSQTPEQQQAPAAPAAAASSSMDAKVEELKKLKELLDGGILTQEEFDAQKQQILGS
jgi:membrane protease subunit (stomatin/prohibitin family)